MPLASLAPGVATFSFKFTDRTTGKQRTGWLGVYNRETFTVEHARTVDDCARWSAAPSVPGCSGNTWISERILRSQA